MKTRFRIWMAEYTYQCRITPLAPAWPSFTSSNSIDSTETDAWITKHFTQVMRKSILVLNQRRSLPRNHQNFQRPRK
jgi:hypothetical protein